MSPKNEPQKSAGSASATDKKPKGFTDAEKAAMKARVQEMKAEARSNANKEEGENAALAAIDALTEPDHTLAKRLHAIIKAAAPTLIPKTWYGYPAYADKDGKVVCFYQSAQKFNTRYAMLGFSDLAKLDDGAMWPVYYALKELTPAVETKIIALVKKAAG